MTKVYEVSYEVGGGVWSANVALAPSLDEVEAAYRAEYPGKEIIVTPAQPWVLEEARRKGKPVVTIEAGAARLLSR